MGKVGSVILIVVFGAFFVFALFSGNLVGIAATGNSAKEAGVTVSTTIRRRQGGRRRANVVLYLQFIDGARSLSGTEWCKLIALTVLGPPYFVAKKLMDKK